MFPKKNIENRRPRLLTLSLFTNWFTHGRLVCVCVYLGDFYAIYIGISIKLHLCFSIFHENNNR